MAQWVTDYLADCVGGTTGVHQSVEEMLLSSSRRGGAKYLSRLISENYQS